jgi:phosphopantetheine adenylyltransferase
MLDAWKGLPNLVGEAVLVDGSFDPLHEGHIAYFVATERLGHPVFCNIAHDDWTKKAPNTFASTVTSVCSRCDSVYCSCVLRNYFDPRRLAAVASNCVGKRK